jgi:ankyrin repeat protein
VTLADAIGRSDLDGVARAARGLDLGAGLPGGLTPFELAATIGNARMAERLLALGAPLEPLPAWMLGWKDRVRDLVANDPRRAAEPVDVRGATMLHHAVERDDEELFEIALADGAALDVRDRWFRATPLEWARHLGREGFAQRLSEAEGA